MSSLCVFHSFPELCWLRFIRITNGFPRVLAIFVNLAQVGCTRSIYPMTNFLIFLADSQKIAGVHIEEIHPSDTWKGTLTRALAAG